MNRIGGPTGPATVGPVGPPATVTRPVEPVDVSPPRAAATLHAGGMDIHRVALVDDHRMFTEALAFAMAAEADLRVVERCPAGGPDLPARIAAARPDVLVVDPAPGPVDLVAELRQAARGVRLLVLTAVRDADRMVEAVRAGALGWLAKDASMAEVLAAVRAVARGGGWLAPGDLGVVLPALAGPAQAPVSVPDVLAALSRQELRVLAELVNGAAGPEIARTLRVSVGTVRTHLHNVFGKLGVHSRLEAVSVARAAGMRPDPNVSRP